MVHKLRNGEGVKNLTKKRYVKKSSVTLKVHRGSARRRRKKNEVHRGPRFYEKRYVKKKRYVRGGVWGFFSVT